MNGCNRKRLTPGRLLSPANDQILLTSAPITQCFGNQTMTAVGPAPHLPLPKSLLVAVGSRKVGPAPIIRSGAMLVAKKKLGLKSPRPKVLPLLLKKSGWLRIGRIQRVIRFQSWLIEKGTTGWMLISVWVRSKGPIGKFQFACTGRLIMLAMGFCDLAARSEVSCCARALAGIRLRIRDVAATAQRKEAQN